MNFTLLLDRYTDGNGDSIILIAARNGAHCEPLLTLVERLVQQTRMDVSFDETNAVFAEHVRSLRLRSVAGPGDLQEYSVQLHECGECVWTGNAYHWQQVQAMIDQTVSFGESGHHYLAEDTEHTVMLSFGEPIFDKVCKRLADGGTVH